MEKKNKIFLAISLVLLLIVGVLVAANYFSARQAMEQVLRDRGVQLRSQFELAVDMTGNHMQQMATFIAENEQVQQLFLQGKEAVAAEGGGTGGPMAAAARQALYEKVGNRWQILQERYDVRQLQFHLGPGSVSFLRVHQPTKFGDPMDKVRHTIVAANRLLVPTKGFETGRINSGIRGAAPVVAVQPETGAQVHVGTLEAGTSFASMLERLESASGARFAVFLDRQHMIENMWPNFIKSHFNQNPPVGDLVLEQSSYPQEIRSILETPPGRVLAQKSGTRTLVMEGRSYGVTSFPLKDYLGTVDSTRKPVGTVYVWRDATDLVAAFWHQVWFNLILAISGFLILELLLYQAQDYVTRQLEATIDEQVGIIKKMAVQDQLTALYNRHILSEMFVQIQARSQRSGVPFAMMMFDLDFFKKINDIFGHVTGDEVLAQVGRFVKDQIRQDDAAFRIGGEEFLLLLPATPLEEALKISERLRGDLAALSLAHLPAGRVTISVGLTVSRMDEKDDLDVMSKRVDTALYAAKDGGRNRVEILL